MLVSQTRPHTRTMQRTSLHVWKLALCTQVSVTVADASGDKEEAVGLCTLTSPEAVQDTRLPGDQAASDSVAPLQSNEGKWRSDEAVFYPP